MGEAIAAAHVVSIVSRLNRQPVITQARFLNWDVAQREHLIILGSRRVNSWIQTALQGHDYVMEHARIVNSIHAWASRRLKRLACMTRPTKTMA